MIPGIQQEQRLLSVAIGALLRAVRGLRAVVPPSGACCSLEGHFFSPFPTSHMSIISHSGFPGLAEHKNHLEELLNYKGPSFMPDQ